MQKADFTGQVFGELEVVECVGSGCDKKTRFWRCKCSCGNEVVVAQTNLVSADVRSCGCLRIKANKERIKASYKHYTKMPEYAIWCGMKERCGNSGHKSFSRYGGRGIQVCRRWSEGEDGKTGFECFIADIGRRPTDGKYLIERKDNDGNYEPGNCIWAKREAQVRNRRSNHWVTYQGERMTMTDAAKKAGLRKALVHDRLNRGWPEEKAFSEPPEAYNETRAVRVTLDGESMTLLEAIKKTGMPYSAVWLRLKKGWPSQRALTEPLRRTQRSVTN